MLPANRFTLVLMFASLAACSEPKTVFRPDLPSTTGYSPPPYDKGHYYPEEEDDSDEVDKHTADHTEPEESESSNPMSDKSSGLPEQTNPTEAQPDVNNGSPTPSSLPTAKSVGNGRVESPYAPGKEVDVQGFPPGSTVRDPYTGQLFVVPIPKSGSP